MNRLRTKDEALPHYGVTVSIFDKLKSTAFLELVRDPRLKELRFHEGEVAGRVGVKL